MKPIFDTEQSAIFNDRLKKIEDKGFKITRDDHPGLDLLIVTIKKSGYCADWSITGLEIMQARDFESLIDLKFATAIKEVIRNIQNEKSRMIDPFSHQDS